MRIEDIEYRRQCLEKIATACFKDNMTGIEITHYLTTVGTKLKDGDYSLIKSLEQKDADNI